MSRDDGKICSFIRARSNSIVSYNYTRHPDPNLRKDLEEEFNAGTDLTEVTESQSSLESTDKTEHIQVYLRLKPKIDDDIYKIDKNVLTCHIPEGSQLFRNKEGVNVFKKFSFSKIYEENVTQEHLFEDGVKEKILEFINGNNSTLFTYGVSGSGKTFTILGQENNPGIIPRALNYIFETIPHIHDSSDENLIKPHLENGVDILNRSESKNERNIKQNVLNSMQQNLDKHYKTYRNMQKHLMRDSSGFLEENYSDLSVYIWVSFAEIYNEYVYDLLQPTPRRGQLRPKLPLGQNANGAPYIKNLTNINVASGQEAYAILQYGMHNLNYAATAVNKHSSRSHCIFTIKLVQASLKRSEYQISHFNFCDLAGSERVKNSCSTGDRLKESTNINTSLHVLGRCIKSLRAAQKKTNDGKLIPFRDSKLTRLFQRALTGYESVSMIVNLWPSKDMFDENQHVLNFSAITKDIMVMPVQKSKMMIKNRFTEFVETNELSEDYDSDDTELNEIEQLKEQIKYLKELVIKARVESDKNETKVRSDLIRIFNEEFDAERKRNKKIIERNKQEYERKLHEMEHRPKSFITIDLTKDEELNELKYELESELIKNSHLKEKLINKQKNNDSLRKILDEAREECIRLKKVNFEYVNEIDILKNQMSEITKDKQDLEDQLLLQNFKEVENSEYVEKLEHKLNETLNDIPEDFFL